MADLPPPPSDLPPPPEPAKRSWKGLWVGLGACGALFLLLIVVGLIVGEPEEEVSTDTTVESTTTTEEPTTTTVEETTTTSAAPTTMSTARPTTTTRPPTTTAPPTTTVPGLIGNLMIMEDFAEEHGLKVDARDLGPELLNQRGRGIFERSNWMVLAQCPKPGTEVPVGSTVRLGVLKHGEFPDDWTGAAVMDGFFDDLACDL